MGIYSPSGAQTLTVQGNWGTVALIDGIADEWRRLCQEGPCDQPFFRPEWIAAVINAFAPKQRLLLITVREGSCLRAVLPLLEGKKSVFGIRFTSFCGAANVEYSCRFDLIHGRSGDVAEIGRAVWNYLRESRAWDAVELPIVPSGGAAERFLMIAREEGFLTLQHEVTRSPYLPLNHSRNAADFSSFGRDARFRKNLRRRRRNLEADGRLTLRGAQKADTDTLQQLYHIEQSGWKGKKGTAILDSNETRQFYDSVAKSAERFGYLSLYFLEQGSSTIAAQFGLTYRGKHYAVKSGYDEKYEEYGPGHLITGMTLRDCVQRGICEYDFLGQQEGWKMEWASEVRPHASCHIFRKSLLGHLLKAATQGRYKLWMARRKAGALIFAFRCYLARQRNG